MSDADSLAAAHADAVGSPPPDTVQACPKKSWIEIRLRDQDGDPVPGEDYKVVAPDGRELTGKLDQKGFARVDGIDPGQCKVTFPRLHRAEWDPH